MAELRKSYTLWIDDAGVWHVRGNATPGQLRLPLFARGRPAKPTTIYFSLTRDGRTLAARPQPHGSPELVEEAA